MTRGKPRRTPTHSSSSARPAISPISRSFRRSTGWCATKVCPRPLSAWPRHGWGLDQLKKRAADSVKAHGGDINSDAFKKLLSQLRYVDGDYADPNVFTELRKQMGDAKRPLHYLAIPPALFSEVASQLAKSGCAKNARLVVEKPFGRDRKSAAALSRILDHYFSEDDIFRIDHYLGKEPVQNILYTRFANSIYRADLESQPCAQHSDHHGREFRGAGSRRVLRRGRRHPRRVAEPHAADPGVADHGPAHGPGARGDPRQEGEPAEGGPGARAARHRARPVRRLREGSRRASGLDGRDLCRRQARHRQLALGGRSHLHPHRQGAAGEHRRGGRRSSKSRRARPSARSNPWAAAICGSASSPT